MMKFRTIALLWIAATALPSCQKVIDVNLNDSDPRYIVASNIGEGQGPFTTHITRSVNFSNTNDFPGVTGALVTITDATAGLTDTLLEQGSGTYQTHLIAGVPGHTYQLYIKSGDAVFTASCTMQPPVSLDTVEIQKSVFGGDEVYPVPVYTDPATPGNYYRLTASVNHKDIDDWTVRSDRVTNGQTARFPFYYDTGDDSDNPKIKSGDSVFVHLQTIDSAVYEFYRTLDDTRSQDAAAVSNPISNIRGGALGYFSAGAVRTRGIKAP